MFKKLLLVIFVSVPFFANSLSASCCACSGKSCKKAQTHTKKTRGCQGGCCGGACSIR